MHSIVIHVPSVATNSGSRQSLNALVPMSKIITTEPRETINNLPNLNQNFLGFLYYAGSTGDILLPYNFIRFRFSSEQTSAIFSES